MTAPTDHCDLCDLPLSQCVHGLPPAPPAARPAPTPRPRKPPTPKARTKPVFRRWTPPEDLKPLIVEVLEEASGALSADEALRRLEERLEGRLAPGDRELTPAGELRWQYAARRARAALVQDGAMVSDEPGVWRLA